MARHKFSDPDHYLPFCLWQPALGSIVSRKCIAVAEMIIPLHKNNFTPFNLGLALQLYHGYGSKHLIETLHAFGICASYTEVRQFLTSAANHEIEKTEVSCIPYARQS